MTRGEREACLPAVRGGRAGGAAQEAQASGAGSGAGAASDPAEPGGGDGLHHRRPGNREDGSHPERGRCLHARVSGAGSRHQSGLGTRDQGAGAADRRTRPTGTPALGQRARVYLAAPAGLGRRLEGRAGAHPAGQADAERACRELPRKTARRVLERKLVPYTERRKKHPGKLAAGVQLRASAQLARLQDAGGVPAESRLCRCGKQTTLPTSAQPRLRRLRDNLTAKPKPRNSSYHWVRNRGQVTTASVVTCLPPLCTWPAITSSAFNFSEISKCSKSCFTFFTTASSSPRLAAAIAPWMVWQ